MLRPLNDRIVVKPEPRVKSALLEVVDDEQPSIGTVVAVGPGSRDKKGRLFMPVSPGDRIRFGHHGKTANDDYLKFPTFTDDDGERYLLMSWKDVAFLEQ